MSRPRRVEREERHLWQRFRDPRCEELAQEFERIRSARLVAGRNADERMAAAWKSAYGSRAAMQHVIDVMAAQTAQDARSEITASSHA